MTRLLAGLLAAAALGAACGGAPAAAPAPAPTPAMASSPATTDALVAEVTVTGTPATFQGGDDHLTIRVVNHGRRIERFAVEAPEWLAEHSFAMGSTRLCDQDATVRLIECGAIPAGATVGYTVRSIPTSTGEFEFRFRPYSIEDGSLVAIPSPAGSAQELVYRESVVLQDKQLPGFFPTPGSTP